MKMPLTKTDISLIICLFLYQIQIFATRVRRGKCQATKCEVRSATSDTDNSRYRLSDIK